MTQAFSGKDSAEISVDAIRKGDIVIDDIRIHPDTLAHQATVASDHGNPQLAANFRRAAELTHLPDEEVMALYEALRPGRSSSQRLLEIAQDLDARGFPLNAQLFRQASSTYARRGLDAR